MPLNSPGAQPTRIRTMRVYTTRTHLLSLVFILSLSALPLRAGTKIIHRWVLSDQTLPKLQKILVIGVMENYLIRQELEDEMERLLAKSAVQGIRSHMVLPPRNELMEGELKQRIKEGDYDGALVIRPKTMRTETKEVVTGLAGPLYVPPTANSTFWPYWNMAWGNAYATSSYIKEETYVSTEFNLYNLKDEKLIWSGETDTVYTKDFGKLAREYARALVKQLKKDKVIGTK
jgi:hypothetical protein